MARKKNDSPMATANVIPGTQEHFADWLKDNPGKDMPDYQAAYPQVVQGPHVSETAVAPASHGHSKRPKAPRSTFYIIVGTTKDGDSMDVLGSYGTGNQANKALAVMGMAIRRGYGSVNVYQCRDKTESQ